MNDVTTAEGAQPVRVDGAETLNAIIRAETDVQISTAKAYPRDVQRVLSTIKTLATLDSETAEDCFYALRRGARGGDAALIEGVSVRLAEIIASSWGNMRVQTRIIANDGKTITAQGVCHDLETNLAVSVEVKRRITDKYGKTYSEDMQVVTGNAASAIAFRNAVLKIVPKAVTKAVINDIKRVAHGDALTMEARRQRLAAYFEALGVTREDLLNYCAVSRLEQVDDSMLWELSGVKNAIKEGTATVAEVFRAAKPDGNPAAAIQSKAAEAQKRIDAAMGRAQEPQAAPTDNN